MAYAIVKDVEAVLGRRASSEEETEQINAWIKGAELIIQSRLGPLDELDSQAVRFVICESVARRVRNPDGIQNERIDDYSYGFNTDAAKASLHITDEEWELLRGRGSSSKAFLPVVKPKPYPARSSTQAIDTSGGFA